MKFTKRFYKEQGIWYIDLPEFLEAGLGTKGNLMLVSGADVLMDVLSGYGDDMILTFADEPLENTEHTLVKQRIGLDMQLLALLGHAPVDYGAYYDWKENNDQSVWLCPVAEHIFQGNYPETIYLTVNK